MDTLLKDLSMARMRKLPIRVVEDRVQFISLIVLQRLQQAAFGPEHPSKYYGPIGTPEKLDDLLSSGEFGAAGCFQLVELKLGRLDAPLPLRMTTAAVEAFNQRSKHGTSMRA